TFLFSCISDKQRGWSDLIKRVVSDQGNDLGSNAVYALCYVFPQVPDKEQAWNDLHKLTFHENYHVRYWIGILIGYLFSKLSDKKQAWDDLHRLADDNESLVRLG